MSYLRTVIFLSAIKAGHFSGQTLERECSPIFKNVKAGTKSHVMCTPRSSKVVWRAMSEEEKLYIVNKHNDLRANVNKGLHENPTASYMMKLVWDDMLAAMAQAHAESCPTKAAIELLNYFPGRFSVEQNFDAFRDIKNWNRCMERWGTIERNKFKYGDRSVPWYHYHHYSRIVFAGNTLLGCGMAMCNDTGSYLRHIFVCNYGPRVGKQVTPQPYDAGTSCSKCPGTCDGKNLCDCLGHTCRNGGRLDPETCKCGCDARIPFKNMFTPSDCALNCTKARKPDGTDLAFYCGTANWNDCSKLYVFLTCPIFCKVCPAADTKFIPEVPYLDDDADKDSTDAFNDDSDKSSNDDATKKDQSEPVVNVAKPSDKLNDDVIIKTKTEVNTEGEAKETPDAVSAAEKAIEEAKEAAAAKTEKLASSAAKKTIDGYVNRFLDGTNDETKERVMEYLKKYNITTGAGIIYRGSSGVIIVFCIIAGVLSLILIE